MSNCAPLIEPQAAHLSGAERRILARLRRRSGATTTELRRGGSPMWRHRERLARLVDAGLVVPVTETGDSIIATHGDRSAQRCDLDDLRTGPLGWRLSAWGSYNTPDGIIHLGGRPLPRHDWWLCEPGIAARRIAASRLRDGERRAPERETWEQQLDTVGAELIGELGEARTLAWFREPREEFANANAVTLIEQGGPDGLETVLVAARADVVARRTAREHVAEDPETARRAHNMARFVRRHGGTNNGEHHWCCVNRNGGRPTGNLAASARTGAPT